MSFKELDPFLCCAVASEIALFKGFRDIDQDDIDMRWHHAGISPSPKSIYKMVTVANVKWYVRNFVTIDDPIWNGDFMAGFTKGGNVRWCKHRFPTLYWEGNAGMANIVKSCPFYGRMNQSIINRYNWFEVPALYLQNNEDSISFMAGVLATGQIVERKSGIYAMYTKNALPYLERWGIPIEYSSPNKRCNLIAPIWPALFIYNMPLECYKWLNIKHGGAKSETYASILWRMYVSNYVKRGGIPFLNSRRWIYYNLGSVEKTETMWLEMGLSQLDSRIRTVVSSWVKNV